MARRGVGGRELQAHLGPISVVIYMVVRSLSGSFTWCYPYLHGATFGYIVIYVVFQGVVPIYMGQRSDCHVDPLSLHVDIASTWAYMLGEPIPM